MKLRIVLKLGSNDPSDAPLPLFHGLAEEPKPGFGPLFSSVVCHVLAVMLLTMSVRWLREDEVDWSKYSVEPLRLHLSQPIFFSSGPKKAPATPKLSPPAKPVPAEGGSPAPVPAKGAIAIARRLELPKPREAAKDAPVILQPEYVPQAAPPPSVLPPLAFWARQTPEPPKPPAKTEVTPGRAESPAPPPKLAAPPTLATPNREANVAQTNVSLPERKTPAAPALTVPNSTTMPIRLRDATESQSASFEVTAGQAVNVMTLAAERRDMSHIEIPKGLQNIPNTTAPADGAAAGADRPHTAAAVPGVGSNTAAAHAVGNPAGAAAPNRTASGAASTNPNGTAKPDSAASTAAADKAGQRSASTTTMSASTIASPAPAAATPAPPSSNGTPADVTRVEHPSNGNFDVVIMQSAARDDLPDLGGMLSGNPVYTVYLRVGDKKEWLLEYCLPVREKAQANPYQVDIEDVGAITPPYPISTLIPNGFLSLQSSRHLVLHGLLTSGGHLQSIKGQDAGNSLMTQLVALLNQWRFRPALRNKQPIDIEVLLVIPPRG
jgi:hypothetical protein